jgi:Protein of unknown function (DUF2924)
MKNCSKFHINPEKLTAQLDRLHQLNPEELRSQWQALFGADPPTKLRASLLIQGIAYRLQEKALGGLKLATVRLLERIADDPAARRESTPTSEKIRVSTGTVLIPEWHGKKHQVTVQENGANTVVVRYSAPVIGGAAKKILP